MSDTHATEEHERLADAAARRAHWKRWGPYLAERQWATVREDYSADGNVWDYFPHDHARSRAYRWGEDGLLGFTDRQCRLCFAVALWNERDPFLKERLFGLTNPQGNHGEDVKEVYDYLASLPTHAYAKALYKYPQAAFPYERLVEENARRGKADREFELVDTGVFEDDRYFDVYAEYAKASPNDVLATLTIVNRGPEAAPLHVLPTVWCRNTWVWGCSHEGCFQRPRIERIGARALRCEHESLGRFVFHAGLGPGDAEPTWLFTDNETNNRRLFGTDNLTSHQKDAFHRHVVDGEAGAVNPREYGTKAAAWYKLALEPGASAELHLRWREAGSDDESQDTSAALGEDFSSVLEQRRRECDAYYQAIAPAGIDEAPRRVADRAHAGLLWSKQFYHFVVADWLDGDAHMPAPPAGRREGRNAEWRHLYCRDVLSMPDKWEYPWFAAWDLAFHMIPLARIDPTEAKSTLIRLMREWYMHPQGQLPAYEFDFSDVNPPVHAYACWQVYRMGKAAGEPDHAFLASAFQKLLLNFTWWVNRKDPHGRHVFGGGFLGLDNVGVFDRNAPLPSGQTLTQADGTAWMAFFCVTMLSIAIELAPTAPGYEDMASKFFEHFIAITDAMNTLGGSGLWLEDDGFYYDQLEVEGRTMPLRARSLVGLIPLIAAGVFHREQLDALPGFRKRMDWFLEHRGDLAQHITFMRCDAEEGGDAMLLSVPSEARLRRVLGRLLDPGEFLSPFGVRSLSKAHEAEPYQLEVSARTYTIAYEPGESSSGMFGGNSNWRGPVWMPINYLIVEALREYHRFFDEGLTVECPAGSGTAMTLAGVADELTRRLTGLFLPGASGRRPCHGDDEAAPLPGESELLMMHEYFHAETGRGLGASHQTGWTALIAELIRESVEQPMAFRC